MPLPFEFFSTLIRPASSVRSSLPADVKEQPARLTIAPIQPSSPTSLPMAVIPLDRLGRFVRLDRDDTSLETPSLSAPSSSPTSSSSSSSRAVIASSPDSAVFPSSFDFRRRPSELEECVVAGKTDTAFRPRGPVIRQAELVAVSDQNDPLRPSEPTPPPSVLARPAARQQNNVVDPVPASSCTPTRKQAVLSKMASLLFTKRPFFSSPPQSPPTSPSNRSSFSSGPVANKTTTRTTTVAATTPAHTLVLSFTSAARIDRDTPPSFFPFPVAEDGIAAAVAELGSLATPVYHVPSSKPGSAGPGECCDLACACNATRPVYRMRTFNRSASGRFNRRRPRPTPKPTVEKRERESSAEPSSTPPSVVRPVKKPSTGCVPGSILQHTHQMELQECWKSVDPSDSAAISLLAAYLPSRLASRVRQSLTLPAPIRQQMISQLSGLYVHRYTPMAREPTDDIRRCAIWKARVAAGRPPYPTYSLTGPAGKPKPRTGKSTGQKVCPTPREAVYVVMTSSATASSASAALTLGLGGRVPGGKCRGGVVTNPPVGPVGQVGRMLQSGTPVMGHSADLQWTRPGVPLPGSRWEEKPADFDGIVVSLIGIHRRQRDERRRLAGLALDSARSTVEANTADQDEKNTRAEDGDDHRGDKDGHRSAALLAQMKIKKEKVCSGTTAPSNAAPGRDDVRPDGCVPASRLKPAVVSTSRSSQARQKPSRRGRAD